MSSALGPTPLASSAGESGMRGPSTNSHSRQMRLKVSYSFDDGNKSNCLARWPHLVTTPVVQVDRDLLVGAVEFKTCILSIIAGSPELVARLGPDYSVYAYDYSEPDIPLVGCGMLSWAMLNTTESATRLMVTGRVSSNAFVFLGNDECRESLEVKIRLQKVDTFTQEQFVNSVHAYQALSRSLPGEFDASTWSSFLNANPRVLTTPIPSPQKQPALPQPGAPVLTLAVPLAISQPAPAPTLEWKESSVSSSEDAVEPPKKKRRGPAKPNVSKKKADVPAKPAQAETPSEPAKDLDKQLAQPPLTMAATTVPRPKPKRAPRAPRAPKNNASQPAKPTISREASTADATPIPPPLPEISPSPQVGSMASSPPGQPEAVDGGCIPSPAPTSPYLPSLPTPPPPQYMRSNETGQRLETLFEEPEHEHSQIPEPEQELEQDPDQEPELEIEQEPFEQEQELEGLEPPIVKMEEPQSDCLPQSGVLLLPSIPTRKETSPLTVCDDVPAPSPGSTTGTKVPRKTKRKLTRKDSLLMSDAVASSDIGDEGADKPAIKNKPTNKSRTAAHVKTRIEMQLMEALKRGEMPNYCRNCGAIETGTWRKVKDPNGTDETEEALKDDQKGKSRFLIEKEKEVLLCNACGLWFSTHKTMRPQQLWESNKEEKIKPNPRKRKLSSVPARTPPASSLAREPSEPMTEPIVLGDEEDDDVTPRPAPPLTATRVPMTPSANRSVSKDANTEWNISIDAGRRDTCSSPVLGSATSPIDIDAVVDGLPSPKRVLFPEARKTSPEKPVGHPMPKRAPGKENQSPLPDSTAPTPISTASAPPPPATPTRRRSMSFQLRTPMRSTSKPMHDSSPYRTLKRTPRAGIPATPDRRLVKSPLHRQSLSPVAGLLEKLLAEDPSVLADISELASLNSQLNFGMDDDFLNTDYTMPSSPLPSSPPTGFSMYEDDDHVVSAADWSDFLPSTPNGGNGMDMEAWKEMGTGGGGGGLTVDLSAFIEEHTTSGGILTSSGVGKDY